MRTQFYFAALYPYGICSNDKGKLIGQVYRFMNKAQREAWVGESSKGRTESGYRQQVKAADVKLYTGSTPINEFTK